MIHKGLNTDDILKIRSTSGFNEITSQSKQSIVDIFLKQLKSPLIYILILAAGISISLKEYEDSIFIIIIVLINSLLGFYQEYKAESTLEKLRERIPNFVKVIRNGKKQKILAKELVPGDLFLLEAGLKVPADGFVIEENELLLNESILTGESEPVSKVAQNISENTNSEQGKVFMGSVVLQGLGIAKVTHIGDSTYYGKIAEKLTSSIDPSTPTKRKLKQISNLITIFVVALTFAVFLLGLSRNIEIEEILLTAVALGVSMIPESLIISFTVVLALGMNNIMKKKAIVKNLPAAETLGNVDILCIDKTGTLTQGIMKVDGVEFVNEEHAYEALVLCNNESNFIDEALKDLVIGVKSESYWEEIENERKDLLPFSSELKFSSATNGKYIYAVGAPEIIESFLENKSEENDAVLNKALLEGKRIISIAYKPSSKTKITRKDIDKMSFIGFVFISDPVRETIKDSLSTVNTAGIKVKIITGDHKQTALSVLEKLNFKVSTEEILSGSELENLIHNEKNLDEKILSTKLFYRTTPDHKLLIVKSLRRSGKMVAMMGDGINDSPAIKNAEIGISVDSATDVTKEVSDLILLDSNFQTIADSIEEGRNIFKNSRKIVTSVFADSLTETVIIVLSLIFNMPLPLLPLHLLWINIIEDGLPGIALAFDKSNKSLLNRSDKPGKRGVFDNTVIGTIIFLSFITDIFYFLIFKYLLDSGVDLNEAQTFMFAGISVSSLMFLISAKTIDSNIWKENIFNNKFFNFSILFGFLMALVAIYVPFFNNLLETTPLNAVELLIIIGIGAFHLACIEIAKYIIHKRR